MSQGVKVRVHDPEAMTKLQQYYLNEPLICYANSPLDAVTGADALLLVTEWPEYWSPDYAQLLGRMRHPLIIDGRNIFDKAMLQQYGFSYLGIGR